MSHPRRVVAKAPAMGADTKSRIDRLGRKLTMYEVNDGLGQRHTFATLAEAERFAAKRNTFTWAVVRRAR